MPEDRFYEGDGPGPEAAERFRSMGEMLWLLRRSPHHAGWGPEEVERNLLHPLSMGQARVFHRRGMPVGFATWAWLDAGAAGLVRDGRVERDGWRSGPDLWIVDLVAPFGDVRSIVRELRSLLPDADVSLALQRFPDRFLRFADTG